MKDGLLKIINHYGEKNQRKKLQEEIYELVEALIEYEFESYKCYEQIRKSYKEHIAEELADCYVILEQIRLNNEIGKDKIKEIMNHKSNNRK